MRRYPTFGWLGLALLTSPLLAADPVNRAEPGWWLTPRRMIQTIPPDASGRELHLILEAWDGSEIVPLVASRRAVIAIVP